jgi:hypothetical protein
VSQHAGLDAGRWAGFDIDQQLLMIANEMNRASRFVGTDRVEEVRRGYERVLRLTDLTVACAGRWALRRELLRWRDLIAELFVAERPDAAAHRAALRSLLQLRPVAAKQIPLLLGGPR